MKTANSFKNTILMIFFLPLASLLLLVACSSKQEISSSKVLSYGCPDAEYLDWETSDYVLPYPVGNKYRVSLSHCSGSYHSLGAPDQFAIDFVMPIGTLITASRAGTVVHVEESGVDYSFPNNLVIVEHEDGTFLQYMHLTNDGAIPEIGHVLVQGDSIGFSSVTGLAGFPHLHLVATEKGSFGYPYISFPTTFKNTEANE